MILSEGMQQKNRLVLVHQEFVDALFRKYHRFTDCAGLFLFHLFISEGAYQCSPAVHHSHSFLITLNCQFISHLNRLKNIRARSVSRREEAKTQNVLLLREHFWARSNEAVRKESSLLHMAPVPGIGEPWPHHDKQDTDSAVPAPLFIRGPLSQAYTKKTGWSGDERPSMQGISSRMNRHIGSMQVITTHEVPAAAHCAIVDNTIPVFLPGKSALLIMKERGSVSSQQYPDKVYAKAEEEAARFEKGPVQGGHSLHEGLHLSKTAEQKIEGAMLREGRQIPPAASKKAKQPELGIVEPVAPRPYDTRLTLLKLPGQRSTDAPLSFERSTTLSEPFRPDRPTCIQSRLMALPTIQVLAKRMVRNPFDHLHFSLPRGSSHDLNDVTGAMPTLASLHSGIAVQKAPVISLGAVTYRLPASARGKGQGEGTESVSPPIGLQRPRHSNDLPRPEFSHADDPDRPDVRLLKPVRTAARQDVPNLTHPPREVARESTGGTRHVDKETQTVAVETSLGPVVTQQRDVHQTDPIDVRQIANRVYGLLVDRITRERKMRGALRR